MNFHRRRNVVAKRSDKRRYRGNRLRRPRTLEMLEGRVLLAGDTSAAVAPWQNHYNPRDVNHDFRVTPIDALLVINDLMQHGPRALPGAGVSPQAAASGAAPGSGENISYVDVNGDNRVSPADALRVINVLLSTKLMEVDTVVTNMAGDPISSVGVGEDFKLKMVVQDIRDPVSPTPGVFSAFVNLTYDNAFVTINGQVPDPGPNFSVIPGQQIDVSSPGQIPGFLAISGLTPPATGNAPEELWTIVVHASSPGTAHFVPSFDNTVGNDSLLYPDVFLTEFDVMFNTASIEVTGPATLSVGDRSVFEGNAGQTPMIFTVSLSSAAEGTVTVRYDTQNDTAMTADNDYVATSGTLTFQQGVLSQFVTVLVNGDVNPEPNEWFNLVLSNPVGADINVSSARGTIQNDEVVPTLAITNVFQQEGDSGNSPFVFTVSLSEAASEEIVVSYATSNGTATLVDNDYAATSGTLTFTPGQTSKLITVEVVGDAANELDETFLVTVNRQSGPLTNDSVVGTGTILNDEGKQAVVRLQVADTNGNPLPSDTSLGGSVDFLLQVYVRDIRPGAVGVFQAFLDILYDHNLVMLNGAITYGTPEYSAVVDPPNTSAPGFIDEIGAIGDGSPPGGSEQLLFSVPFKTIGAGLAAFNVFGSDVQDHEFLVYLDDDPVPIDEVNFVSTSVAIGTNALSIFGVQADEGTSGPTQFVFQVTRFVPSGETATVVYTTVNGTATVADNDFVSQTGTLTFSGAETSKPITIIVNGDTKSELDETFFVNLSNPSGADIFVGSAAGKIVNDDAVPRVSVASDSGNEGGVLDFVVTLSAPSGQPVTVPFFTTPSVVGNIATAGSDYTSTSGTLTFGPGVTQRTISVQTQTDLLLEPNETFRVVLGTPTGALLDQSEAEGTIVDVPPATTLTVNNVQLLEGNAGSTLFLFTVSLSNISTVPIVVSFATADGSATVLGNDYLAQSGTLTFNTNEVTKTVTVTVLGDTAVEASETFSLNFTRVSGPVNQSATGTGTILNDDGTPSITINDVTVVPGSGGANAVFTVTLSTAAAQQVTVGFATEDFTALANVDYVAQTGNLTFTPGGSLTRTITVPVLGSTTPQANESFKVNLSSVSPNALIGDAQGVATIIRQGLSVSNASVLEGNPDTVPQNVARFTVSLSTPQDNTVTVAYSTSDGTATAGADYTAVSNTLTFTPGQTTKEVTVAIVGDGAIEPHETFLLNLSSPSGSPILNEAGIGTIINDDGLQARIRLQLADSNGVDLPSGASLGSEQAFQLKVFVQDIQEEPDGIFQAFLDTMYDSNLVTLNGPIVFGPGFLALAGASTSTPGLIDEIGAVDVDGTPPAVPGIEQLFFTVPMRAIDVGLANFSVDPADGFEHDVLLYLADQPVPPNRISFVGTNVTIGSNVMSVGNIEVEEGNSGPKNFVFTVTRFLPDDSTATVQYATEDGTATAASGDYVPKSGTLTFGVGEVTKTITVTVNGDTTDEPHETFLIRLSNPSNAEASSSPGVGTILNDDGPVEVSIADATASEGQNMTFVVTLSAVSGRTVIVPYNSALSPSGNLATEGLDYLTVSGELTFAPGVTQQTITVLTLGDALLEVNETFELVLGTPTNGILVDGQARGTIVDVPPALITGQVYVDLNNNGLRDPNESGLENVIITATLNGGGLTTSVLTLADGTFSIVGLVPGTYTLTETQPGFFRDGRDTRFGIDSPTNDSFSGIVLGPSQTAAGFNFGELGVRPEFVSIFLNRRAFFATAIVTGFVGPEMSTGGTVNPSTGDLWISFDGGWDGQRTINALFNSALGSATMTLYNNAVQVVANSVPTATGAQLTYTGTSGAAYFLRISGTNPSVQIVIGDPVAAVGVSSTPPPPATGGNPRANLFASSSSAGPAVAPQTAPDGNDLVWSEDDDWVADSLLI